MDHLCTKCWKWDEWPGEECPCCQRDFSTGFTCPDCNFVYLPEDKKGGLCLHCSYVRPILFPNWYPSKKDTCQRQMEEYRDSLHPSSMKEILGGVMPHAGWYFSGAVAASVVGSLREKVDVFVIFGAVHRVYLEDPCLIFSGKWKTPLGDVAIDHSLAAALMREYPHLIVFPDAHESEHSIEMEVPFVKYFFPEATIVPIMVPPRKGAVDLGKAAARAAQKDGRKIVFLASSDLSHYGDSFSHSPCGPLPEALERVHQIDHQILDLALSLEEESIIGEARAHRNACGPGAIAAVVAASKALGAERGELLEYTTSMEVRPRDSSDATVGYGALVLGK